MMPNKTIYVAENDLPIFEKAQELAGGNLSATIAQALRRFIEEQEGGSSQMGEIIVKVGRDVYTQKRFQGRRLAGTRLRTGDERRAELIEIYQTAKGRIALYTGNVPDWRQWPWGKRGERGERGGPPWGRHERDRRRMDPQNWGLPPTPPGMGMPPAPGQAPHWGRRGMPFNPDWWPGEFKLEDFDTLEEIKDRVPEELYRAALQALNGNEIETLDI